MLKREQLLLGLFLLLVPLSALTIWQLLEFANTTPSASDAIEMRAAFVSANKNENLQPVDKIVGQTRALPHDWREGFDYPQAWYYFELELQVPPDRLWGIYLSQVEQNAVIYLNGEIAGSRGRFKPYPSRFVNQSLYFPLANGLIKPGLNQIAVRVVSYPKGRGYLGRVFVGPDVVLRPFYERKSFIQSDLLWFFVAGSFGMSFVVALLAWQRPNEKTYHWLAAQIIFWSIQAALTLVIDPPIPEYWLVTIAFIVTAWFCATAIIFGLRFIELRLVGFERYVLGAASLGTVTLIGASLWSENLVYTLGPISTAAQMIAGPVILYHLFKRSLRTRNIEYFLVLYVGIIIMLFGAPSFRISIGAATAAGGQYLYFATPIMLAAFAMLLFRRFVLALERSEELTLNLDKKVNEKTIALEDNHRKLRELEREHVLVTERERIMRDMHDGVGGHLVASLARLKKLNIEDGSIRRTLENALTDLRLMIDSLEGIDGDLNVTLGMLRTRLGPQMSAAGLSIVWQVDELPLVSRLNPDALLHIMRLLQEAITNIAKHAKASIVTITACARDQAIEISIVDNGVGFTNASHKDVSRGISNMHHRAREIGGQLTISSTGSGTRVTLLVEI